MPDPGDAAKVTAARHAVAGLAPGPVALGTGSTTGWAVRAIAERFPGGAGFEFVASSRATEALARSLGLPIRDLRADDRFAVMLDGADEATPSLALTKGGGGALLREKLLAELSAERLILVDPTKLVRRLGEKAPIPIEIVPFTGPVVIRRLESEGYRVSRRTDAAGAAFLTDNANEILDLVPARPIEDPRATAAALRSVTGVIETGIFTDLADRLIVGHPDGRVEERRAPAGRRRR